MPWSSQATPVTSMVATTLLPAAGFVIEMNGGTVSLIRLAVPAADRAERPAALPRAVTLPEMATVVLAMSKLLSVSGAAAAVVARPVGGIVVRAMRGPAEALAMPLSAVKAMTMSARGSVAVAMRRRESG